ncbi:hypothetical protein [Streptococcus marmotae]|uniref:hypothetical protein n=1 Tax=Streptococcus marmotae TaxID=1825069 RepID=UPI00082BC12D|nr:hypothetical protein [Streptococcus marmotae]
MKTKKILMMLAFISLSLLMNMNEVRAEEMIDQYIDTNAPGAIAIHLGKFVNNPKTSIIFRNR